MFAVDEYQRRLGAVRVQIVKRRLDAIIVSTPENICYLTGYQTAGYYAFQCLVVPVEREPFLVVRELEVSHAEESTVPLVIGVADHADAVDVLAQALESDGLASGVLGVERDSWFLTSRTHAALETRLDSARLIDASGTVEAERAVKSVGEIELIRRAANIAERTIVAGAAMVRRGVNENEIAAEMYRAAILAGSDYPSLPMFVASGPRTAHAHSTWAGRALCPGDLVLIEAAGTVGRYSGALMRTFAVEPSSAGMREAADIVATALQAAIAAIRPGATSDSVDRACRSVFDSRGAGSEFKHRTGYSIGINFPPDWGEGHILSLRPGDMSVLRPGMVIHLVPVLLRAHKFGMGFSETVLVTSTGAEVLTTLGRDLLPMH